MILLKELFRTVYCVHRYLFLIIQIIEKGDYVITKVPLGRKLFLVVIHLYNLWAAVAPCPLQRNDRLRLDQIKLGRKYAH